MGQFNDELAIAVPGDRIVYYTGLSLGVELVQRRKGDAAFDYIAFVRRHVRPPVLNGAWLEETGAGDDVLSANQAELTEAALV
jgi:hypothetical protein